MRTRLSDSIPGLRRLSFTLGTGMVLYLLKVFYEHQNFLLAFCFCMFRNNMSLEAMGSG